MIFAGTRRLLRPKFLSARSRTSGKIAGKKTRLAILGFLGLLFWVAVFGVPFRVLGYFRGIPEIGPLIAGKLLGMIFLSFFGLLVLSNLIAGLSTFFLARDLDMVNSAPVDWLDLYIARLLETLTSSSWMVVLMAAPIFTAYEVVFHGGFVFPLLALLAFVPFLLIPAAVGSMITMLLVNIFPARRTKEILALVTVIAAAGLALLFRLLRPEQLARPEGFRSLVEFITLLRAPSSPWLPSEWLQMGLMGWLREEPEVLPFYLLWSTAAAALTLGAAMHWRFYTQGFSRAQESTGSNRSNRGKGFFARLFSPLGTLKRELILKEVRLFFRDTTQWSQLILLAVLVVVYVFNIRYLPLGKGGLTFFLTNVIPFLNIAIAGFVLASIAARFIFPSVSLEGRTLWLLRSSPTSMRDVLWSKYWVGTAPLLTLAVIIIFVTNALLDVSGFMMGVSLFTIVFLTCAIASLALALGTLFPQFESENAAQIPTSFGGLLFMMASVSLIGITVLLEGRPVYEFLVAKTFGLVPDTREMIFGFTVAGLICVAVTLIPLRIAERRLEAGEL
jgi:ABC-2 type transport system permease protein